MLNDEVLDIVVSQNVEDSNQGFNLEFVAIIEVVFHIDAILNFLDPVSSVIVSECSHIEHASSTFHAEFEHVCSIVFDVVVSGNCRISISGARGIRIRVSAWDGKVGLSFH